jgi:hypothetical protein
MKTFKDLKIWDKVTDSKWNKAIVGTNKEWKLILIKQ